MDVNSLVKKWIENNDIKKESEYEEAKRKFEMALGKPFITLQLEIPLGFDNYVKLSKQFITAYPDQIFTRKGKSCIGHEFVDKIKDALDLLKKEVS